MNLYSKPPFTGRKILTSTFLMADYTLLLNDYRDIFYDRIAQLVGH
jgi:hypothetical protein